MSELIERMRQASVIYAEAERAIERNDMAEFNKKLAEAKKLLESKS